MIKSCEICGTPREIKTRWKQAERDAEGFRTGYIDMVSTACLFGHWYGGPIKDISVDVTDEDLDSGI